MGRWEYDVNKQKSVWIKKMSKLYIEKNEGYMDKRDGESKTWKW